MNVGPLYCSHIFTIIEEIDNIYDTKEIKNKEINQLIVDKITQYTNEQLDLLALFLTLVKILYLVGFLQILPSLISFIGIYKINIIIIYLIENFRML